MKYFTSMIYNTFYIFKMIWYRYIGSISTLWHYALWYFIDYLPFNRFDEIFSMSFSSSYFKIESIWFSKNIGSSLISINLRILLCANSIAVEISRELLWSVWFKIPVLLKISFRTKRMNKKSKFFICFKDHLRWHRLRYFDLNQQARMKKSDKHKFFLRIVNENTYLKSFLDWRICFF